MIWWLFYLKLFDYVETCVFVLRKKQNQISFLHAYHHVSNVLFGWYYLKYVLDERASIVSMCNCAVHVIMYIYYFIAAWSPELKQMIYPIKPFITKLQMASLNIIYIIKSHAYNVITFFIYIFKLYFNYFDIDILIFFSYLKLGTIYCSDYGFIAMFESQL